MFRRYSEEAKDTPTNGRSSSGSQLAKTSERTSSSASVGSTNSVFEHLEKRRGNEHPMSVSEEESSEETDRHSIAASLNQHNMSLIQQHWKEMGIQVQKEAVQRMFIRIFDKHPQMRPIWPFGRVHRENTDYLKDDPGFCHHADNVHEALSSVVEHWKNPKWFRHIIEDIGSRHFFYDAIEPHFDILQEALIHTFKHIHADPERSIRSSPLEFTPDLEKSWNEVFDMIKKVMQNGVSESRKRYLTLTVTAVEMENVKKMWLKVEEHGLELAGIQMCQAGATVYENLLKTTGQGMFYQTVDADSEAFKGFAKATIKALDKMIHSYDENFGYSRLPKALKPYVETYMVTGMSPTLARKAMMEGFINTLTYILGEVSMTSEVQRTWLKLYRVMEQAIITNVVNL